MTVKEGASPWARPRGAPGWEDYKNCKVIKNVIKIIKNDCEGMSELYSISGCKGGSCVPLPVETRTMGKVLIRMERSERFQRI